MTIADRRRLLHRAIGALNNWPLDPAGRVLEDALEEDGFVQLANELRKVTREMQALHDRALAGWALGDEAERAQNHERSARTMKRQDRLIWQASNAVDALGRDVWWWADVGGIVSGRRGQALLSFPVEVMRRNPGGYMSGRIDPATMLVKLLGPFNNRALGQLFLTVAEHVTRDPKFRGARMAPGTAGWLRR